MIKISEHVRNAPNCKLLDILAYADYGDLYPENIPDKQSGMSKLNKLLMIIGGFLWKFQAISEMELIFLYPDLSDRYPVNIPDL